MKDWPPSKIWNIDTMLSENY